MYTQELDIQDEQINQTSGKFDELNNILSITQQRINKFKVGGNKRKYNYKNFREYYEKYINFEFDYKSPLF